MQGKEVDMDKLMRQHELMPAIGNVKVNARGDELGSGGKIIRKREEVMAEYYENNPKVKKEGSRIVETKPQQNNVQPQTTVNPPKKVKNNENENEN
jgi:hypothetical protein